MADLKFSELAADTPEMTDIFPIIVDPGGTPVAKKVTFLATDALFRLADVAYSQTNTVTVASTATETTLVGTGLGSPTLVAGDFNTVGKAGRIKLWGWLSNVSTPTLNLRAKLGSIVIAATGDVTLASGQTDVQVELEVDFVTRSTGASGTVIAAGKTRVGTIWYPMLNLAVSSAIDLTGTLAASVTADWSANDAGNTIKGAILLIERLN